MLASAQRLYRLSSAFTVGPTMTNKLMQIFSLDFRCVHASTTAPATPPVRVLVCSHCPRVVRGLCRSLAFFRCSMAFIVLLDIYARVHDLNAFYTDETFLKYPDQSTLAVVSHYHVCLHRINTSAGGQLLLFLLQALFATALLVGYRTRVATVASFVLLTSLHSYVPLVLNGGDDVMRVFLFWGMFLPLGRVFSVDAAVAAEREMRLEANAKDDNGVKKANKRARCESECSIASMCFVVNLCMVYWSAAAFKTGYDWVNGLAVYYALHSIDYATKFATVVRGSLFLNKLASWFALRWEIVGPMMYLMPIESDACRLLAVGLFFALHFGFWLCLRVGMFSWAMIACHFALIPSSFWTFYGTLFFTPLRQRCKLVYDSEQRQTALCVHLFKTFLLSSSTEVFAARVKFAPGDAVTRSHRFAHFPNFSEHVVALLSLDELRQRRATLACLEVRSLRCALSPAASSHNTKPLQAHGKGVRFPSLRDRWALVLRLSALAWPLAPLVAKAWQQVSFVLEWRLVQWTTAHTAHFLTAGTDATSRPAIDHTASSWTRRLSSVSLALLQLFCLFLAIYANLSALHVIEYHPTLDVAMRTARLDQWWGMFAPQPSHSSRYYLISGVTVNNTETDLWDGGPALLQYRSPSFRVPTVAHFESARWRRVLAEMGNQRSMMFYAHFLCKQWNAYGPGRLGDGHRLKTVKTIRRTVPIREWNATVSRLVTVDDEAALIHHCPK